MLKYRLSQFLVFATFVLLFIGGLVTSTDSGLAVPDWPLSFGGLFPPMTGGIRFEHTHRVIAATVGLLTLILTLWIGLTERTRSVRWLAIASLAAVVFQGLLGGMTVLYKLPVPVSVAHACLGPIFFSLVVALTVIARPVGPKQSDAKRHPEAKPKDLEILRPVGAQDDEHMGSKVVAVIFLQILFGAIVRHTGKLIWIHIGWAFVVLGVTGWMVSRSWSRTAVFLGLLVVLEFFLGIGAFVFSRLEGIPQGWGQILFPTLHQTLGALILATATVLNLRTMVGAPLVGARQICSGRTQGQPLHLFFEITKPRLVMLVLWTVSVGFLLASPVKLPLPLLFKTLFGTAWVAAGSMALNQYLEREPDARMKRTETRPLPSGRMSPSTALALGSFLSLAGILILAFQVNFLSALLAAVTLGSYLFIYTPLKTRTPFCTLFGAVPGAIPPMIGWAAVTGRLDWQAWILFTILFLWQLPHFFAIAWIWREDYERAGFRMLSVVDPTGKRVGQEIMIYTLAVLLASLVPAVTGMSGLVYYGGAFLLGIWFLAASLRTAFQLDLRARSFFRQSVLYLGLLFFLMWMDKKLI